MFYVLFLLCISSYYFSLHAIHDDKLLDDFETECGKYLTRSGLQHIKNIFDYALKTRYYCLEENEFAKKHKKEGYQELTNYYKAKNIDFIILHPNLHVLYRCYANIFHRYYKDNIQLKQYCDHFFHILFQQSTKALEQQSDAKSNTRQPEQLTIYIDSLEQEINQSSIEKELLIQFLRFLVWIGHSLIMDTEKQKKFSISFKCNTVGKIFSETFFKNINMTNCMLTFQNKKIDLKKEDCLQYFKCVNDREREIKTYQLIIALKKSLINEKLLFQLDDFFERNEKNLKQFKNFLKKHELPFCPFFFLSQTNYNVLEAEFKEQFLCLFKTIMQPFINLDKTNIKNDEIIINIFLSVSMIRQMEKYKNIQLIEKLAKTIKPIYEEIGRTIKAFFKNKSVKFISKNEDQDKFFDHINEQFLTSINDTISKSSIDMSEEKLENDNQNKNNNIHLVCIGLGLCACLFWIAKNECHKTCYRVVENR